MSNVISGAVSGKPSICGVVSGFTGSGSSPPYTGGYSVTPKCEENIILPTKNKVMTGDLFVEKIPQYEVGNPQGGETLIIGGNVYGS